MLYFVSGVVGFLLGMVVVAYGLLKRGPKPVGTIVIDHSIKEEEPYLFIELNIPVKMLQNESEALVKIESRNYLN